MGHSRRQARAPGKHSQERAIARWWQPGPRNDFGKIGYGGPCPPPGKPHRYYIRVFALDTVLGLKPGAGRGELERAMEGHILARGELMGRFAR